MPASEPEYATKSDVYYIGYMTLSAVCVLTSATTVLIGEYLGVVFLVLGVIAYSMGVASKYDGFHSRIWRILG